MGKIRKKSKVKDMSVDDGFFEVAEVTRKWYENSSLGSSDDYIGDSTLSDSEIKELRAEAIRALENEDLAYSNRSSKLPGKSNYEWLRTIMTKGTVSDRIAANTIMIQNSPVHNLSTLRNLVNMVKVGKKKECITVIETLTELFLTDLLVPDKKLRTFENCPLAAVSQLKGSSRSSRLIHWYFEDQLKELYRTFIQALQTAAQDTVETNKEKAITAMYKLLAGNPEQESLLLTCIVNKLGDPSPKVSSKTIHCLTRLLQQHPNMKFVVMQEIEKLLFRPNVSSRAQYYGICFLTLFILSREDMDLAVNLINLYFSFFKACLKRGDIDTRLMSALLMGVNRAYPFAKEKLVGIEEQIETVYKVVHIASFNVSVHALRLLYQVADYTSAVSDRFYSALYKKLVDPQLCSSSHQAMFLNLVFRALKQDVSDNRVKAFIKRLLQVCLYVPVPLVCGILYLISQLVHNNKALLSLTMKASTFSIPENADDEEDEHYEDVKIEETEESHTVPDQQIESKPKDVPQVEEKPVTATWFHCQNLKRKGTKSSTALGLYDPYQRNPLFAGGDFCAYTELMDLCHHFHPTVSLFASKILQGETISYSGDPLQDFTLSRFLDRFVFKNPKKQAAHEDKPNVKFSRKSSYQPLGIKSLAVNSASYLSCEESAIPVEELFMYKYLSKKKAAKTDADEDAESDVDSVGSEEFESMMDNLMGGKEKQIDYADEVGDKLAPSKDQDSGEESEDEEDDRPANYGSDNSLEDDDSAEEIVFDDDGEEDEDIQFDINNLPDDDDDDDDIFEDGRKEVKGKKGKKRKDFMKGSLSRSVFASADEFAEMLEDAGDTNLKLGGLASMSNKDKAGVKQLKWEMDRDHWLKGPKQRKRKGQPISRFRKKLKR
ncbi:CCAAT/enhancer-binding protein zeta [Anabrus simplex]|uniref:CCAAT/enhancer-binding protein zeta n=1 Tax=Anabrus simplex TaxID=316456 RepID=UPI0035A31ADC